MTFRHQAIWRNDDTLFQAGLASVGNTWLRDDMLWRLALACWRQGEVVRALPPLDEAVARRPLDLRLRLMRAGLFQALDRVQDAHLELGEAVRLTGAKTQKEAVRKIAQFVQLRM